MKSLNFLISRIFSFFSVFLKNRRHRYHCLLSSLLSPLSLVISVSSFSLCASLSLFHQLIYWLALDSCVKRHLSASFRDSELPFDLNHREVERPRTDLAGVRSPLGKFLLIILKTNPTRRRNSEKKVMESFVTRFAFARKRKGLRRLLTLFGDASLSSVVEDRRNQEDRICFQLFGVGFCLVCVTYTFHGVFWRL